MEEAMRLFGTAALGREAYRNLSEARKEQIRDNLIRPEFIGSGFPPLETERLRGIRTPALLLTGQSSPRVFHRLADRLEEILPRTERVEIPDASHIMHEDNAPAFNTAVLSLYRTASSCSLIPAADDPVRRRWIAGWRLASFNASRLRRDT